jgi:predicted nucleic acid-binding protein
LTLADTSVWVDFFHGTTTANTLGDLLETNEILLHPWVLGELVLGGLGPQREAVITDLRRLPTAPCVPDDDVLELVVGRHLWGRGIGWVDVHLLASALVTGCRLWTFDRSLAAAAEDIDLGTAP